MRSRVKRRTLLTAAVAVPVLVAGCADIPSSGDVGVGNPKGSKEGSFLQAHADGPTKDASPVNIVQGFLKAATDTANNFEVAREFLTSQAASNWKPTDQVTVYPTGSLPPISEGEQASKKRNFSLNVPVLGTVDARGVYESAESESKSRIKFKLTQTSNGWRISKLADGLILSRSNFETFFKAFPIYFYDNSFDYLVPELRWFVSRPGVLTNVVDAVLDGPSKWLHGAAVSAFPSGTKLAAAGAVNNDGKATINLDSSVLETSHKQRALMAAELTNSVSQVQSVSTVDVVAGGRELDASASKAQPERQVDSKPVLISGNELQLFSSGRIQKVSGTKKLKSYAPSHPTESFGLDRYAFLAHGKKLCEIRTDTPGEVTVVAQGDSLVPPSYDPHGWLWTAEQKNGGSVLAIGQQGRHIQVDASWLDGRKVKRLEISRDGARAAVLLQTGSGSVLRVAGVQHDNDGTPEKLTSGIVIGKRFTAIKDISWAGPTTLSLIGKTEDDDSMNPWTVGASGPSSSLTSVPGARTITSANDALDTVVGGTGGSLYRRVGSTWSKAAVSGKDPSYAG